LGVGLVGGDLGWGCHKIPFTGTVASRHAGNRGLDQEVVDRKGNINFMLA
jgi:hypothetical protein